MSNQFLYGFLVGVVATSATFAEFSKPDGCPQKVDTCTSASEAVVFSEEVQPEYSCAAELDGMPMVWCEAGDPACRCWGQP